METTYCFPEEHSLPSPENFRHTRPGTKTLRDRPKINLVQYTTRPVKREPQTKSSLDWQEKGMRVGQKLNGKDPFS